MRRLLTALLACVAAGTTVPIGAGQATTPADRYLTVNGLRLHYLDWGGAGPPLILVHGLDRHAHTFDHIAPHFASRYRVIAGDMRGHGESAWDPDARYVVEDYVRDMEGFVDQLNLRNIVIWGNSTGGRVAQVYAGLHADRVTHMISEDVGPERPRQIADNYQRRVNESRLDGSPSRTSSFKCANRIRPCPSVALRTTCATERQRGRRRPLSN